jgi:hypothetical protein
MRFIARCRHFESTNCRIVTMHRYLTTAKKLIIKFQILDTFVRTEESSHA